MTRETPVVIRITRRRPEPVAVVPPAGPLVTIWDEYECTQALHISQTTLREWRRDGLPAFKRGRVVLFVAEDVIGWLRSQYDDETRRTGSALRRVS